MDKKASFFWHSCCSNDVETCPLAICYQIPLKVTVQGMEQDSWKGFVPLTVKPDIRGHGLTDRQTSTVEEIKVPGMGGEGYTSNLKTKQRFD